MSEYTAGLFDGAISAAKLPKICPPRTVAAAIKIVRFIYSYFIALPV